MTIAIKRLAEKDEKKWDAYVSQHNHATFCHQTGWKYVIRDTYRHDEHYLFAENENGEIVGILPLFLVKDLFFGSRLISIPFVPYGGICCDTDAVGKALIDEAVAIGEKNTVDYFEMRQITGQECTKRYQKTDYYVTSVLPLSESLEKTLENMQRNKRKNILKSERNGLHFRLLSEDTSVFFDFFDIYSHNSRRLGTPQHSREFFENMLKYTNSDVMCVYKNDEHHYGAFAVFFRDTVIDFISSSFIESRKLFVTDFGVWNLIKMAHEKNYHFLDFGRSIRGSDNLESKRRWGVKTTDLEYCYPIARRLNSAKLQPKNYGNASLMWSRLPLSVTKRIGPVIRRFIV